MTDPFAPRGPHDVSDLIAAFPLAWMVAHRAEGSPSILLPLLADLDADGALVGLTGHMPRSHPLTATWNADPGALVLFQGPQGWPGLVYYRLHGSPKIYHSAYEPETLGSIARDLAARADAGAAVWCFFDNTALGAATDNALSTQELNRSASAGRTALAREA